MAIVKWDDIHVEPLNNDHDFSDFYCVSEDLNDFIKNDARREQECMLSRTYLFSSEKDVVGFVSLSADSVSAPRLRIDDLVRRKGSSKPLYSNLPCILIGRLAVVKRYERQGIGTNILNWAVGLITNVVCKSVGCRYITVDPKTESLDLYTKSGLGFTQMEALKPGKTDTRYYINIYKLLND
jgi:GNAT superfamily N-acetyltransferase